MNMLCSLSGYLHQTRIVTIALVTYSVHVTQQAVDTRLLLMCIGVVSILDGDARVNESAVFVSATNH